MLTPTNMERRRALLVEDDDFWLDRVTRYLQQAGCDVTSATTVAEAGRAAERAGTAFDVAVIDVRLRVGARDQSGLMLFQRLADDARARAFIIITSAPDPADQLTVEARGGRYLSKADLSSNQLSREIDALLVHGVSSTGAGRENPDPSRVTMSGLRFLAESMFPNPAR